MRRRAVLSLGAGAVLAGCSALDDSESVARRPEVLWRSDTGPVEQFVVGPDRVFAVDPTSLRAFDRDEGSIDWSVDGDGIEDLQYDEAGRLYVAGDGGFRGLDPATGDELWSVDGAYQSVTRTDAALFAYDSDGFVNVCVDPETGDRRWRTEIGLLDPVLPSLAVSYADDLSAVDLGSGTVVWSVSGGTDQLPVAADADRGLVAVVVDDDPRDRLLGVDAADGTERWRAPVPAEYHRGGVLDDTLFVTETAERSDTGSVLAFDPESGDRRWRRDVGQILSEGVPVSTLGDRVLFTEASSATPLPNVCAFATGTGERNWCFESAAVAGTLDDGVVLVDDSGEVRGVKPDGSTTWRSELPLSPMGSLHDPPRVAWRGDWFAIGYERTNVVSAYSSGSGRRLGSVTLDGVFRGWGSRGRDVYVTDADGLVAIRF